MITNFERMVNKDLRAKMFFEMIERVENETDENELEILSNHKTKGIRLLVAANENTNSKTLRFLSFDDNEEIREAAKLNKNFVSITQTKSVEVKTKISIFDFISSFFSRKELKLA